MALRLKLKISGRSDVVVTLNSNLSLQDLSAVLSAHVADLPPQQAIQVRAGVPPILLDCTTEISLGSVCKSGDILHIDLKTASAATVTPTKATNADVAAHSESAVGNSSSLANGDDDVVALSDDESVSSHSRDGHAMSSACASVPSRPQRGAAGRARGAIQAQIAEDEAKARAAKKSAASKAKQTSTKGGSSSATKKARVNVRVAGAGHVLGHVEEPEAADILEVKEDDEQMESTDRSGGQARVGSTPQQPPQPSAGSVRTPLSPQPLLAQLHSARLERHPELAQQASPATRGAMEESAETPWGSKAGKRKRGPVMPSSEAGLEALLVGAGRGGSGGGSSGGKKLARAAFQEELDQRYEDAAANARLAAAQMGTFTVQRTQMTSGTTRWAKTSALTCAGSILVRYKGVGERSWREDRVDELRPMFVPAVLEAILQGNEDDSDAKQSLRPYRLASTPKFFWAAVRCGSAALRGVPSVVVSASPAPVSSSSGTSSAAAAATEETGVPVDVEAALKALLPTHTAALEKLFSARERRPSAKSRTQAQAPSSSGARAPASGTKGQKESKHEVIELDENGEEHEEAQSALPSHISSILDSVTAEAVGSVRAPMASASADSVAQGGQTHGAAVTFAPSGPAAHPGLSRKHVNDGPSIAELDVACMSAAYGTSHGPSNGSGNATPLAPSLRMAVQACVAAIAQAIGLSPTVVTEDTLSPAHLQTILDCVDKQLVPATTLQLTNILCTFRKSQTAPVSVAAASSDSDNTERQTFVCDSCGKNRVVTAAEADLDTIAALDTWTCTTTTGSICNAGIPSLMSRGGCRAPDDDLAALSGSHEAAVLLETSGFPSIRAVACSLLRDTDVVLYGGPCKAPPEALQPSRGASISNDRPLAERLRSRILPPAMLIDAFQEMATEGDAAPRASALPAAAAAALAEIHAKKQLGGGKTSPQMYLQTLPLLSRGHCLLYAAALWLLGLDGHAPPSEKEREKETQQQQAAYELLCNSVGFAAASALAHAWRDAAVVEEREEELAAILLAPLSALAVQAVDIVQGKGQQGSAGAEGRAGALAKQAAEEALTPDADAVVQVVMEIVEQRLSETCRQLLACSDLEIAGPADLRLYEGQEAALLSTLNSLARSTGVDAESSACIAKYLRVEDVCAWTAAARATCARQPWLCL